MSNSNTTIQFLRQNPSEHFIRITDMSNDTYVGKKDIYLDDIANENLQMFIQNQLNGKETEVWVEHRFKKGASNLKTGQSYKINFIIEKPVTPVQEPTPQAVAPVIHEPIVHHATPMGMGNPFGLSAPQIMDNMMKANKLDDVKETLTEVKAELIAAKSKIDLLDNENRKLKTDLSIAEKEKEMAILSEKLEKRQFYDSPAFEKLMEKAPDMIEKVVALKMGASSEVAETFTGLASPNISETKREFFEFATENCTDQQINYLGSVLHFTSNTDFITELTELLRKYGNN